MYSDIYEPIWFKLGMMINNIELNILKLVFVTFTLIQGCRDARKQELDY